MSKFYIMVILAMIALSFLFTVAEMPQYGISGVPARDGSATHYLQKGVEETKALNMISAILVDYRAYDTLIETTVLFTAVASVLALVTERKKKGDD